jgi:hypothetical protein
MADSPHSQARCSSAKWEVLPEEFSIRENKSGLECRKAGKVDAIPISVDISDNHSRCIQVAWSSETDNPAVWAELMNKIKDGILSAFDSAVSQREDEVKRSEGQRQMPGWNFCTFFILKVWSSIVIGYIR